MSPPLTRDAVVCVGTPSSPPTSPSEPKLGGLHRPLGGNPNLATSIHEPKPADLDRPVREVPATPTFAPCATAVDRSARPEPTRSSRQRPRGRSPSITEACAEHAQAVCPVWPTTATPCTPAIVTRCSRRDDGWLGAEAPRHPPRSESGQRAPPTLAQHVDTSPAAAVPPASLAATTQTRCCHRIHTNAVRKTSGCLLCCHRRRRQLRSSAPASLPPQHSAFESRPKPRSSRIALQLRARARPDTQAGAPQQTITSAHFARCPEPTVPTSPPTRPAPRVRASSPVPNRDRQAIRSPPRRSELQPGSGRREPKPAPPFGNEAVRKPRTTFRHPRAVLPPRSYMISAEAP